METKSGLSGKLPFYLFAWGVFLLIVSRDIFSNGMFLDGLIYSTVSRNLADGIGTFWNPRFTDTFLSDFHEHPPLAFGIQSLFYMLLGESRYIDRIYSLVTVAIVSIIILKIWHNLGYKQGWIPMVIWLTIPTVFWASYNNLLENTVTVFTSLTVLFYLKNLDTRKILFVFLSGFMMTLGFLTKGFVAFFPLTFPFILWLVLKQKSFLNMLIDSLMLTVSALAPLLILILAFPVAELSLHKYWDWQVVNSVKNIVTVHSRFDIVKRMISELAPAAILCVGFIAVGKFGKFGKYPVRVGDRKGIVFALLGLTGVLPVMISLKQSGFYILPAYPFFAISFGIVIYPLIDYLFSKADFQSKGYLIFRWIAYGLFSVGVLSSIFYSGGYSRDKTEIQDSIMILAEIPEGTIINIDPDLEENWGLHAYFYRFNKVSLDPDLLNLRDYLLIKNNKIPETVRSQYKPVQLNTIDYQLFKKEQGITLQPQ